MVQRGDTLRSIAQAVYGNAAYWYVIAQANAISSDSDLSIDQNLTLYSASVPDKCCPEGASKAMNNLLIYIGEGKLFDFESTVVTLSSMGGVTNQRIGTFVGAIFECEYVKSGLSTIVRISPELETIVLEGLHDISLEFAIKLQERSSAELHATDMNYSFNVSLKQLATVADFRREIGCNRLDVGPDAYKSP